MRGAWLLPVFAGLAAGGPGGLDGTYRATVTPAALRTEGTPPDVVLAEAGTWTLAVEHGAFGLRQERGALGDARVRGDVEVTGESALFHARVLDGIRHHEQIGRFRWRRGAAGELRFRLVGRQGEDLALVLAAAPWRPAR